MFPEESNAACLGQLSPLWVGVNVCLFFALEKYLNTYVIARVFHWELGLQAGRLAKGCSGLGPSHLRITYLILYPNKHERHRPEAVSNERIVFG